MRYRMLLLGLVVAVAGCASPLHNGMSTDACGGACGPSFEGSGIGGPGVGGPGPGVMMYEPGMAVPPVASQVAFVGPEGMFVSWDVSMPGQFDSEPLVCPGRYNFPQGGIYRLKLTNVPGRPGVELYPTLEVGPAMPRTQAFLAHNAMPVQMTNEDIDQVLSGNFVTKVIYLPDPEYQELALAGVETLVSTRLDPGVDPIVEADRRGSIMGVLRLGNKDLEIPSEIGQDGSVVPASFLMGPNGVPTPMPPNAAVSGAGWVPSNYISGVTGPQYGVPMTATPSGLPGPPYIPLGIPTELDRRNRANRTAGFSSGPTHRIKSGKQRRFGYRHSSVGSSVPSLEPNTSGSDCQDCR